MGVTGGVGGQDRPAGSMSRRGLMEGGLAPLLEMNFGTIAGVGGQGGQDRPAGPMSQQQEGDVTMEGGGTTKEGGMMAVDGVITEAGVMVVVDVSWHQHPLEPTFLRSSCRIS